MGEANPEHMTVVSVKCVGSTGREGGKNLWHFKCQRMWAKAKICLVFISFVLLLLPHASSNRSAAGKRSSRALISSSGGFDTEEHLGMYILDDLQLGLCVTESKKGADGDSEHE